MKCHEVVVDGSFEIRMEIVMANAFVVQRLEMLLLYRDFSFWRLPPASAFNFHSSILFKFFSCSLSHPNPIHSLLVARFSKYHHCCFTIYLYLRHHRTSNIVFCLLRCRVVSFFLHTKKGWTNYSAIIFYYFRFAISRLNGQFPRGRASFLGK